MRIRRAGWVIALVGGVLAVVALVLNAWPGPDSADANIGAGILFLAALGVIGVGVVVFVLGAVSVALGRRGQGGADLVERS